MKKYPSPRGSKLGVDAASKAIFSFILQGRHIPATVFHCISIIYQCYFTTILPLVLRAIIEMWQALMRATATKDAIIISI